MGERHSHGLMCPAMGTSGQPEICSRGVKEIVIFAQLEGVQIGVCTRDKTERKSPLYKAREAGLPTATKKVMLQCGETARGAPHFWNILPLGWHCNCARHQAGVKW